MVSSVSRLGLHHCCSDAVFCAPYPGAQFTDLEGPKAYVTLDGSRRMIAFTSSRSGSMSSGRTVHAGAQAVNVHMKPLDRLFDVRQSHFNPNHARSNAKY